MTFKKSDWIHHFPFPTVRQEQEDAINTILTQFYSLGKNAVIAELGTGVGKSAIALTVARWINENKCSATGMKAAYIITSQKLLQDQYAGEWGGRKGQLVDLRASGNFPCSWSGAETCAETMRIVRSLGSPNEVTCSGGKDHRCPYKAQKDAFLESPVGTTNYSYLLNEVTYAGALTPREVLILDECHGIEDVVKRWATVTISRKFSEEIGARGWPLGDRASIDEWLVNVYKPALVSLIAATLSSIKKTLTKKGNTLTPALKKYSHRNEILDKHICGLNRYLDGIGGAKHEFLMVREGEDGEAVINIKPVNVTVEAAATLYGMGRKQLLLSATVLDRDVFCRSAGIDPKRGDIHYFSIPTPFTPESYGIKYMPVGRMSRKDADETAPRMVEAIKGILAHHPDQKGIIHAASYEVCRRLSKIKDKRLLIQTTSSDRDGMLEHHKKSKSPTILVSPAMVEGIDLKDDLGRLQILCKIPYPYIGDDVVSKKMKEDPRWYAWIAVRTIVQSVGRCVRNENDWTTTYILDSCFSDILNKYSEMLPDHFSGMDVIAPYLGA